MTEEQVVEELLMIHHMAMLRMYTCTKFCQDGGAEEELINEIIPEFEEKKRERLQEAIGQLQEQSTDRCQKELQRMFKNSALQRNSYEIEAESLQDMREDLQKILKDV